MEINAAEAARIVDSHRGQPEVTLEQHVRKRRVELGRQMTSKYKVYLDLRFWILFREVELGRNGEPALVQLLNLIKEMVEEGVAICPIADAVFVELMKQSDPETRLATARLIDQLSNGVTLVVNQDRVSQELCNAIYALAGATDLIPVEALVWTKLVYAFGEVHPHNTPFEASEELVIQKSIFDHMWALSLIEMMEDLDVSDWDQPNWQLTADRCNAGNRKHAAEVKSFPQVYRHELAGLLNLLLDEILQISREVYAEGYKNVGKISDVLKGGEQINKLAKSLRTLHIGACCHAAVRWDQKRQLTGNDLLDFHHAQAAIGYCDLFLTENPLKTLLSQRHLGLLADFPCKLASTASGALEVLSNVER